ncbi:MAG: biotin synthase BioB [Bacteroidetes bacterium]|nr:biotin synthase BioB [Bacteroidota bacterium]
MRPEIRNNYSTQEVADIYHSPLLSLVYQAATVHRQFHNANEVQKCTLLSVKTGGCPEDCAYCPQAARYHTDVKNHGLLPKETVLDAAQKAKASGSSRFCMGAAWREVRDNRDFDKVLDMVHDINDLGLEVCCTLGMVTEEQAQKLSDAGVYAYNHNIDTSEENYSNIISTRNFDDRLRTLENVRKTKMTVCSGGIVGLGETDEDRIHMLQTLANMEKHPESVPINALVAVEGTPLENQKPVDTWTMVRMIASARILMPESMVRLSAGRLSMSEEAQAMCFMAGANSIFTGEKLLTTPNPEYDDDMKMFDTLGLVAMPSSKEAASV